MNGRLLRRLVLCLLAALVPLPAAASSPARVSESSADGLTIEYLAPAYTTRSVEIDGAAYTAVEAPGLSRLSREGFPDLPFVSVPFALPPGADLTVTVLAQEEERVPISAPPPAPTQSIEGEGDDARPTQRFVANRAFYGSSDVYPREAAAAGARGRLRFQDVAGVTLHPFRYDAAAGELIVSARLVVRVSWGRPGAMPKGREPASETDKYWEPVYRSLLPNYEEARAWRSRPAVRGAAMKAPHRAPALDGPQWKIPVNKSDLYRVDASALSGLPAETPVGALRLTERIDVNSGPLPYETGEVPIHVVDADEDGFFGAGDSFVFYGLSNAERFAEVDIDTLRCTDTHVYWLSLGGGGRQMAEAPGHRGYTGLTAPATFETWVRFEENNEANFLTSQPEASEPWDLRRVRSDHIFWTGPGGGTPHYLRFDVRGVDLTANSGLRVHVQSMGNTSSYLVRIGLAAVWDDVPGQAIPGSPFTVPVARVASTLGSEELTIPPGYLGEGQNQVVGEFPVDTPGLHFNSIDVGYMRKYEAYQNRLDLTSGTSIGPSEFKIARFTTNTLPLLFDVTDRRAPVRLTLDGSQLVRQGAQNFLLTFQDDVATARKYIAATAAALPAAAAPVVETAPDVALSDSLRNADYIMICYDGFLDAVQPLRERRESQGHRVELVAVSDVFDEFSGGRPSAVGILRYLRWAMNHRKPEWGGAPPAYVLLVGDASLDVNGDLSTSGPNLVPTPVYFANAQTGNGRELVSMDPRYVLTLTSDPGEADWFEDLSLGRISAGTPEEVEAQVQKVLAYENFQPGDAWRGSVFLLADDQFHIVSLNPLRYCYQPSESAFKAASEGVIVDVRDQARLDGINMIRFYVADHLDTVAVLNRCHSIECCPDWSQNLQYSRAHVTPALTRQLSQGHLLVMYQGHANSSLLADEYILAQNPAVSGYTDVNDIQNIGRPFVFFGFACHINQFARETERLGETFGENLCLPANRGAVAAFASSGYEWLSSNPPIERAISKAFFLAPPKTDLATGSTRWVLGPTMAAAKAYMVLDNMPFGQLDWNIAGMVETYCLLGEPALRMDALPPEYQVTVDGERFAPGARLRASAGRDSVLIRAEIRDELDVRPGSVALRVKGVPVADTLFTVEPPADTTAASRPFVLTYEHRVAPDTYDIEIAAQDLSGRSGTFRIPVVLDATFQAAGVTLGPNGSNALPPRFGFRTTVGSPAALEANHLSLLLDGTRISSETNPFRENPADPGGLGWVFADSLSGLADGSHTFTLRVDNGVDPPAERSVSFTVNTGLAVSRVFNFPNPFSSETRIFYTLSRDARDVQIRIYTVAGRLIRTMEGTRAPGVNPPTHEPAANIWDGRDTDGDAVANGLYFYRLVVTDVDEKRTEVMGRIARAR